MHKLKAGIFVRGNRKVDYESSNPVVLRKFHQRCASETSNINAGRIPERMQIDYIIKFAFDVNPSDAVIVVIIRSIILCVGTNSNTRSRRAANGDVRLQ